MATYSKANFTRIWKLVTAYIASIDFPTEVALLAVERSVDSGNSADATFYDERNDAFQVLRGENLDHEEMLPLVRVDILRWPHDTERKDTSNRCQTWSIEFLLTVKTMGNDRDNAEIRCLDAVSVIIQAWLGAGSRLGGINRDETAFDYSVLQSGGWDTAARGDQYVTSGQLVLSAGTRIRFT